MSSGDMWRSLRSALCAALVVLATFSIYPLSIALSERAEPEKADKNFEIEKFSAQRPPASAPKSPSLDFPEFAQASKQPQVPASAPEIPAQYGDFAALKSAGFGGFNAGDFEISQFAQAEAFDVAFFEFSQLDKVPKRLGGAGVRYPKDMLERGVEGLVELSVFIDEEGSVSLDKVLSATNDSFKKAALELLPKLLYEAPMRGGKPVKAKFILPIPFKIVR